jgi:chitinase
MKRHYLLSLLFFWPAVVAAAQPTPPGVHVAQPKIVGYFAEWDVYQRNYHVKDIPADKLTHINYAFAKIGSGQCALYDSFAAVEKAYPGDTWDGKSLRGNFHQLELLKKNHTGLKTLVSVGGWTLSGEFSDVAFSDVSRQKFARSCVAFIKKYGFDGVDIDWEYPGGGGLAGNRSRKEDTVNFTLLLAELRKQFEAAGQGDHKHYLLTIAAPAGASTMAHIQVDKIHPYLDWLNVMTYDFHGGWDKTTGFNAPLYPVTSGPDAHGLGTKLNADSAIKSYLAAGVPPEKLVLGVPFYGRAWGGVKTVDNGLFQSQATPAHGAWDRGTFEYYNLAAKYIGKYERHWNDEAKVPWLFDAKSGLMISYDDPQSIKLKAAYAREHKLGGVMIWELSGDDGQGTLMAAARDGLKGN